MVNRTIISSVCLLGVYANFSLALGINCRGSGLCPRASWNNNADVSVIQLLRDAVYAASAPLSTSYESGDHVICVSQSQQITIEVGFELDGIGGSIGLTGSIGEGGICLFPQYMADGATLSLEQIRPLMDALLKHGCSTCGSVPIHFVDQDSNDPSEGILTFNYVAAPYCVDNCISAVGGPSSSSPSSTFLGSTTSESSTEEPLTTTVFVVSGSSTSADDMTQTTTAADQATTTVFVVVDSSTSLESMGKTTSSAMVASSSPTPSGNDGQLTRVPPFKILVAVIGSLSIYMTI
ncbi:hypothetical protein HD806DRAFT_232844 [Xylariaceae sp. AK1471]|nr:hypothetical protein HD806DRAFT_232844 [Xylariaceae sp. AK1471]